MTVLVREERCGIVLGRLTNDERRWLRACERAMAVLLGRAWHAGCGRLFLAAG